MKGRNKVDKHSNSYFCPDSCESLYGGKCIMRINNEYSGGFVLLYEQVGLGRRYIRRESCSLKESDTK